MLNNHMAIENEGLFYNNLQEWKVINPYHVHVRRRRATSEHFIKMSLQLYQVQFN